ncbi:hypothetical protein [Paenibacillus sp. BAC0078]
MEQANSTLILDLLDVHNIRVNVEDKQMTFVEAVETEARSQGVEVSGAHKVVLPENHGYLKESIETALKHIEEK